MAIHRSRLIEPRNLFIMRVLCCYSLDVSLSFWSSLTWCHSHVTYSNVHGALCMFLDLYVYFACHDYLARSITWRFTWHDFMFVHAWCYSWHADMLMSSTCFTWHAFMFMPSCWCRSVVCSHSHDSMFPPECSRLSDTFMPSLWLDHCRDALQTTLVASNHMYWFF